MGALEPQQAVALMVVRVVESRLVAVPKGLVGVELMFDLERHP